MQIPIINLAKFFQGNPQEKKLLAKQVDEAMTEIGFLVVVEHDVPEKLIVETVKKSQEFFDQSMEEKMKIAQTVPGVVRGYFPLKPVTLAGVKPDLNESFVIGSEAKPKDSFFDNPEAKRLYAPNIWPERPAGLNQLWTEYFNELEGLSNRMYRLFAASLGAKEDFFLKKADKAMTVLRARHYIKQVEEPLPGQIRAGSHVDFGIITYLLAQQDKPGGLQVQTKQGEWIDMPAVKNSFILNLGEMFQEWTNDRWMAPYHRVINPPRDVAPNTSRLSMVYSTHPNYNTMINSADFCRPGEKPHYAPISVGDYMTRVWTDTAGGLKPEYKQRTKKVS